MKKAVVTFGFSGRYFEWELRPDGRVGVTAYRIAGNFNYPVPGTDEEVGLANFLAKQLEGEKPTDVEEWLLEIAKGAGLAYTRRESHVLVEEKDGLKKMVDFCTTF